MKIQWEYDLVERPFCEQLKAMGWQWIEGDTDVPDFTERANFREVLLKGRLATALRKLNLRDGQPWLPVRLVDYIVMHELVHLVEGHHGPEFWQALGRAMPDWQKRKDALADKAKDYLVFGLPSGRAGS